MRGYGACDVINYRSEDLRERIKSITSGEGVDICFDNVGGAIFEQMARLMKWGGRMMPIGFTSGQIPSVPMNLPLLKNYSIVGVFAGAWVEKFPEQAARMNDTLMQLLAEGKIRPHIDRVLASGTGQGSDARRGQPDGSGKNRPKDKVERAGVAGKQERGKRRNR